MRDNEQALRTIFRQRLHDAKKRAKVKNLPCNLTVDYLIELYYQQQGRCYLSNKKLKLERWKDDTLSIDRIDPTQGYIFGNVGLACWCANKLKNNMQLDDFYRWCGYIWNSRKC